MTSPKEARYAPVLVNTRPESTTDIGSATSVVGSSVGMTSRLDGRMTMNPAELLSIIYFGAMFALVYGFTWAV